MDRSRENKSKLKQSQLYLGTGPEPKEVRLKFKDARTKARLKAYVFLDRLLSIFTQRSSDGSCSIAMWPRLHNDRQGEQQVLWLGQDQEAERVFTRFKKLKEKSGAKNYVTFLSYLLHVYLQEASQGSQSNQGPWCTPAVQSEEFREESSSLVVIPAAAPIALLGKRSSSTPSGKPAAKNRRNGISTTQSGDFQRGAALAPPVASSDQVAYGSRVAATLGHFPGSCLPPGSSIPSTPMRMDCGLTVDRMPMKCSEGSPDFSKNFVRVHHPGAVHALSAQQSYSLPDLSPPTDVKPWHQVVESSYRQKNVMKVLSAKPQYSGVAPEAMRNAIEEEMLLFERAQSLAEYIRLVNTSAQEDMQSDQQSVGSEMEMDSLLDERGIPYPEPPPTTVRPSDQTSRLEANSLVSSVAMAAETLPPVTPSTSSCASMVRMEVEPHPEASSHPPSQTWIPSPEFGTNPAAMDSLSGTPPTNPRSSSGTPPTNPKSSAPTLTKNVAVTPKELSDKLRPVLNEVWNRIPESYPFRQDPKSLELLGYSETVRHQMDLGTISKKLKEGKYRSGWEFCEDMWLMVDNARRYYMAVREGKKKGSRVRKKKTGGHEKTAEQMYTYSSKLLEVFNQHIDGAMKSLGYCCGQRRTFHPQVLSCEGEQQCTIPRGASYYLYSHQSRTGSYCRRCFSNIPGDAISVGDDPMTANRILKSDFRELMNNTCDNEPMVECIHCGRVLHQICALYMYHEEIWPDGFQCSKCHITNGTVRKENRFSAKGLPTTKLSTFLEDRVNNFLRMEDTDTGEITIRVVSSGDKTLETRTNMRERFRGMFPTQFPYRTKAIFAFQKIDGAGICFFGMHVQEYGSDCPAPNTRCVYISYLDSVCFFRPCHLRTQVYHEILIGYLQFCEDNGFQTAHIWVCPASEGDDYIFHCHPVEQKMPSPKRLGKWYKKMLDTSWNYQDIFKYCEENGIASVTEIPYFEGDFWPNKIEETIKKAKGHGPKKVGKRSTNKKGNKKAGSNRSKSSKLGSRTLIGGDDLSQKVFQAMKKHAEEFFVVMLQPSAATVSSPLPGTTDPDQLIQCDLMDGRDTFLTMARERHWEFSSLRRARYSTMAMLYELHNRSGDRYHCHKHVKTPPGGFKIPTPPSKDSPSPIPAISNPAAVAASPITPRSVGKDGPRTPGKANTPQPPPSNRMVAPPPASLQQAANSVPPTFSQPEQSIPAPNVTVSQSSALNFSGEIPITQVAQPQQSVLGNQVQQALVALFSSDPRENEKARHFMAANPDIYKEIMFKMDGLLQGNVPPLPSPATNDQLPLSLDELQVQPQANATIESDQLQRSLMYHSQQILPRQQTYHGAGSHQVPQDMLQPYRLHPSGMPQAQQQPNAMMMSTRPQQPMMYPSQKQPMVQQHQPYHGGQQVPHHTPQAPPSAHGPQTAGWAPGQMYQSPVNPQQSQLQQMLRQPAQQHYQMAMDPGMQADMYSQNQYSLEQQQQLIARLPQWANTPRPTLGFSAQYQY